MKSLPDMLRDLADVIEKYSKDWAGSNLTMADQNVTILRDAASEIERLQSEVIDLNLRLEKQDGNR